MPAEIRNCEFRFQCTKTWDSLKPTEDLSIRFCEQCQRTVHYCRNETELHDAIVKNKCVAAEIRYAPSGLIDIEIGEVLPPSYLTKGGKAT